MDKQEEQRIRQWIRNWETAVLGQLRAEAIRNSDTVHAIKQLSDAFESARRHFRPSTTSRLVEQQCWLARLRP